MDTSNHTTPHKNCTKCGNLFPATAEYFARDKSKRDGLYSSCKACVKTRQQQERLEKPDYVRERENRYRAGHKDHQNKLRRIRYANNPEKVRDVNRAWRHKNPERVREHDRQKYLRHKDKCLERSRKRYRDNIEAEHEYRRRYYQQNAEEIRAKAREYAKANPEKMRRHSRNSSQNRRARMLDVEGSYKAADICELYKGQAGNCWWCAKPLEDKYEIDHRIPIARGGTNYPSNLCLTCVKCNRSKGAKLPHEWSDRLL